MSSGIKLDGATFAARVDALFDAAWNENAASAACESLVVCVGNPTEQTTFQKSSVMHSWLLGYEFTDCVMLLHGATRRVGFLASAKKCAILETLTPAFARERLKFYVKAKDASNVAELFAQALKDFFPKAEAAGTLKMGCLAGETVASATVDAWTAFIKQQKRSDIVDFAPVLAELLAVKDAAEKRLMKNSAATSCTLMRDYVVEELLSIIDEERRISHAKIAEKIEKFIGDEVRGTSRRLRLPADVNKDFVDICYAPVVQSGGVYAFRAGSTRANNDPLHFGVIVCALGLRYRSYCSNVARTFLIAPSAAHESAYTALLALHAFVVSSVKSGVRFGAVYDSGRSFVEAKYPAYVAHLGASFGHGIGIEFVEAGAAETISSGNETVLRAGMTLNVAISFTDVPNPEARDDRGRHFSLLIADTVLVAADAAEILTADCPRALADVSYFFKSESEEEREEAHKRTRAADTSNSRRATRNGRAAATAASDAESRIKRRTEHQADLADVLLREMTKRYAAVAENSPNNGDAKEGTSSLPAVAAAAAAHESYKKDILLPKECRDLRIFVDKRNDTVVLPILGMAVPFHAAAIKNASKSDEGDYAYLRINFHTPTADAGAAAFTFVRSATFRSGDAVRVAETLRDINEVRRLLATREAERREAADLVRQEALIEVKGRRPLRLGDVHMRPAMEGKRVPGELEIHANGIRYRNQLRTDQRIDILFENIKHFFFQPCDGEMVVLLHCHLKNHIMIGKKRTKDVQFFREAVEAASDETAAGRRRKLPAYGDDDELLQEQEERRRRAKLNDEFKAFAARIAEQSTHAVDVDMPLRDLGFEGVPVRQNVLLMPTRECLVQLIDPPFTVVTMADVEIAHLERVVFGLKSFDLVFVFKDHKMAPYTVTSIPMAFLEQVKEWLDSMDVVFAESTINLNWSNIMKTINDDAAGFYETGGWSFLQTAGAEAASDSASDDDEGDSAYSASDDGDEEEASDDDASDEEVVSEDEDASEEAYSDASDDDEEDASADEDAPDWDELEAEAERHDRKAASMHIGGGSSSEHNSRVAPAKRRK